MDSIKEEEDVKASIDAVISSDVPDIARLSETVSALCERVEQLAHSLASISEGDLLKRVQELEQASASLSSLTKSQTESLISAAVAASGAHAVTVVSAALEHDKSKNPPEDPAIAELKERWKFFAGVTTAVITLVGNIITALMLYMQHTAK